MALQRCLATSSFNVIFNIWHETSEGKIQYLMVDDDGPMMVYTLDCHRDNLCDPICAPWPGRQRKPTIPVLCAKITSQTQFHRFHAHDSPYFTIIHHNQLFIIPTKTSSAAHCMLPASWLTTATTMVLMAWPMAFQAYRPSSVRLYNGQTRAAKQAAHTSTQKVNIFQKMPIEFRVQLFLLVVLIEHIPLLPVRLALRNDQHDQPERATGSLWGIRHLGASLNCEWLGLSFRLCQVY